MKKETIFNIIAFIVIASTAFVIYANSLNADFQFDDEVSIVNNSKIRDLHKSSELAEWKNINYRPLSMYTFALNYAVHELDVFGYHFINLVIHILGSFFVFLLIKLILSTSYFKSNLIFENRKYIALFGALIFVAHPIQTMAVTYIVQRMAALATLFYIMTLFFYLKGRLLHQNEGFNIKIILFYIGAFIAGILGVLSKQNAVTFPLAIILIELYFVRNRENKACKLYLIISASITSLIFVVIGLMNSLPPFAEQISKSDYLLTQFRVIVKYVQLLFVPIKQNIDYDFPISTTLWGFKELGSLLIIITLLAASILLFKNRRLLSFGIIWFLITLSVESSIIPLYDVIMEHRLNLPMFGFSIFLVGIIWDLFSKYKLTYFYFAMSIIILCYSILTFERNKVWKTKQQLWLDTVEKSPNKARPHNNLGYAYWLNQDYNNALKHYEKAVEIKPNYVEALNNLGLIHLKNKNTELSLWYFNKVISLNPTHIYALNNLGIIYMNENEFDRALQYFNKALKQKPDFVEALYNSGRIWQAKNEIDKSMEFYNKALKIKPDFSDALYNLGNIMYMKNELDLAINYFNKTIKANPKLANAYNNLGNIWYLKGNKEKAKEFYLKTISIDPFHKEAKSNLEVISKQE